MRDVTITTILTVTEVCSRGACEQTTSEQVVLSFTADDMWSALGIAAREAGVDVGTLLGCYVSTGLSLAGYELGETVAA